MTCTDDTHGGFIRKPTPPERTKRDRINRLRTRLLAAGPQPHPTHVAAVLHGILDLLGDEL